MLSTETFFRLPGCDDCASIYRDVNGRSTRSQDFKKSGFEVVRNPWPYCRRRAWQVARWMVRRVETDPQVGGHAKGGFNGSGQVDFQPARHFYGIASTPGYSI